MLGYPVSTVADIATDPQLAARGFWRDMAAADGGLERHCGCFAIIDGVRPPPASRNDAQVETPRAAELT